MICKRLHPNLISHPFYVLYVNLASSFKKWGASWTWTIDISCDAWVYRFFVHVDILGDNIFWKDTDTTVFGQIWVSERSFITWWRWVCIWLWLGQESNSGLSWVLARRARSQLHSWGRAMEMRVLSIFFCLPC